MYYLQILKKIPIILALINLMLNAYAVNGPDVLITDWQSLRYAELISPTRLYPDQALLKINAVVLVKTGINGINHASINQCGAVAITPRYLLTAAHCLVDIDDAKFGQEDGMLTIHPTIIQNIVIAIADKAPVETNRSLLSRIKQEIFRRKNLALLPVSAFFLRNEDLQIFTFNYGSEERQNDISTIDFFPSKKSGLYIDLALIKLKKPIYGLENLKIDLVDSQFDINLPLTLDIERYMIGYSADGHKRESTYRNKGFLKYFKIDDKEITNFYTDRKHVISLEDYKLSFGDSGSPLVQISTQDPQQITIIGINHSITIERLYNPYLFYHPYMFYRPKEYTANFINLNFYDLRIKEIINTDSNPQGLRCILNPASHIRKACG